MYEYVYGLDIGTGYTKISYCNGKTNGIIDNLIGDFSMPSVVCFEDNGCVAGKYAKENMHNESDKTLAYDKFDAVDQKTLFVNGNEHSNFELLYYLTKSVVHDAEERIREPVQCIIGTYPYDYQYFDRLKFALKEADVGVCNYIVEPVAAAIAYGSIGNNVKKNVLVFDLGSNSMDITVMQSDDTNVKIISSTRNTNFGGGDWTDALIRDIQKQHSYEYKDSDLDEESFIQLKNIAEKTKIRLSVKESVQCRLRINGQVFDKVYTREYFESITNHLINHCIDEIGRV